MSDPIVSTLQVGQIIPQCGTTLDVIVSDVRDVTISGKSLADWPKHLAEIVALGNGLLRVRLFLSAGHRLRVGDQ